MVRLYKRFFKCCGHSNRHHWLLLVQFQYAIFESFGWYLANIETLYKQKAISRFRIIFRTKTKCFCLSRWKQTELSHVLYHCQWHNFTNVSSSAAGIQIDIYNYYGCSTSFNMRFLSIVAIFILVKWKLFKAFGVHQANGMLDVRSQDGNTSNVADSYVSAKFIILIEHPKGVRSYVHTLFLKYILLWRESSFLNIQLVVCVCMCFLILLPSYSSTNNCTTCCKRYVSVHDMYFVTSVRNIWYKNEVWQTWL